VNVPLELPLVYVPPREVAELTLPVTVEVVNPLVGLYRVAVPEKEHAPVIVGITATSPELLKNAATPDVLITPATPENPLSVRFQSPTTLYGPQAVEVEEPPHAIIKTTSKIRQAKHSNNAALRNIVFLL
jgi:hypothetical protein